MTVYLSPSEQRIINRALQRSTRLIASGNTMNVPPNIWRSIPIHFWVMDSYPLCIPPLLPGTINYAIPEPCKEYLLEDEIYSIFQRSLLLGHSPAGLVRGLIKTVTFSKSLNRSTRDVLYASGINPIVKFPDSPPALFGQMFITRNGDIARIVPGENLIHTEFIALTNR